MTFDLAPIIAWVKTLPALGVAHTPALVIALSVFLIVPVLALAGWWLARPAEPVPDPILVQDRAELALVTEFASKPVRIELPGTDLAMAVRDRPIRIGRQADNDIQILEATVHGYHAVATRTNDGLSVIDDLSGPGGNGMRINGAAARHAVLAPGDIIELGKARLAVVAASRDETMDDEQSATREYAA